MPPSPPPPVSEITVEVLPAAAFAVARGFRVGEPIGTCDEVTPGDVFQLDPEATPQRLALPVEARGAAAPVAVARHRLMSGRGDLVGVVVLARGKDRLILPQTPLLACEGYTLIDSTADPGPLRGLGPVIAALAHGTGIILADGSTARIETLRPGVRVLTRDHGAQPLRWLGRSTLTGTGHSAPVVFRAGTMGNPEDLIVAPTHRMFVFPHAGEDSFAGLTGHRRGVLVEARHLIDHRMIVPLPDTTIDLYALVFDAHEIIYAGGIPCESHLVTEATLRQMPEAMSEELRARFPELRHRPHYALDGG